jgi:methylated-DNA-[protein]-cysteine S-methyltransferase
MSSEGFALFDTPIGRCGIAWSAGGVTGVQLPEASEARTRARLQQRFGAASEAAPPPAVKRAIGRIGALLAGRSPDLSEIALDMSGVPDFHRRVYAVAREIPPGSTLSYGEVAARAGAPGGARAAGQALGRNPFAIVVPCHRVLAANGKLGGFSANGGIETKRRMLEIEGARLGSERAQRSVAARFDFDPDAAVAHLRAADREMRALVDAVGPFTLRLKHTRSVFGALAESIVFQQLSTKAAETIYGRFCALFPHARRGPEPDHVLGASDAALRSAGLSRGKVLALRDLSRRAAAGELPTLAQARRMSDAALIEQLSQVRGIGRWSVEMFLIFRLGRPDVLSAGDYGVRKGYALTYRKRKLPEPEALARIGERWAPYRSAASWYFWRALELPRAEK